jgi:hypothetical protein
MLQPKGKLRRVCIIQQKQGVKLKSGCIFFREQGISFLQGAPKIMVLSNFEDKDSLHFFQELKQSLMPTLSSSPIPFA